MPELSELETSKGASKVEGVEEQGRLPEEEIQG